MFGVSRGTSRTVARNTGSCSTWSLACWSTSRPSGSRCGKLSVIPSSINSLRISDPVSTPVDQNIILLDLFYWNCRHLFYSPLLSLKRLDPCLPTIQAFGVLITRKNVFSMSILLDKRYLDDAWNKCDTVAINFIIKYTAGRRRVIESSSHYNCNILL